MSINRRFLATTAEATTETEQTKSVTVSGALATSVDWNEDLNDESSELYTSTAASAKADLESLLTSSDDVQSATVTITGFEEASSNRKRRQANTSKATVNYSAECTVPESKSTDDISSSVETAVHNADPDNFSSFDSSSFASFSVEVEETTEATTQNSTTLGTDADTTVKTTVDTTVVTTTGQTTAGQTTDATSQPVTTTSNDATTQAILQPPIRLQLQLFPLTKQLKLLHLKQQHQRPLQPVLLQETLPLQMLPLNPKLPLNSQLLVKQKVSQLAVHSQLMSTGTMI